MHYAIGKVRITKVVEIEAASSIRWILPEAGREQLLQIPWLQPHYCTADGRGIMSIHTFVIEADGLRMLVDTCIGNDKKRRGIPTWNDRQGPFLQDLTKAGFAPDSIDRVLCTHLHVDHVGWNTRWQGERWVPTFPRARYLFGRDEYAHWSEAKDERDVTIMQDSVQPVVDAGQCDLIESDHRISDSIWLEPTPGHTPGHVCVRIRSEGEEAVITGDLIHHPSQCAHPDWPVTADWNADLARRTRKAFLERFAGTPTLILGTHFGGTSAGKLVKDGDAYRLDAI